MTKKHYQIHDKNAIRSVRILLISLCLFVTSPLSVQIEYQFGVGVLSLKQSMDFRFNQEKGE